jgi:hypothetical protein
MPRLPDHPIYCPHPAFFQLVLQTKHFRHSTLGSPLRDAWVALAWPLGGPRVAQSQTQSAEGLPAEGLPDVPITRSPILIIVISGKGFALPITRCPDHQITRFWWALPHFSAIHSNNHARTSSPAPVMSFTTLCLTWFIVHLARHCTAFVFTLPERSCISRRLALTNCKGR